MLLLLIAFIQHFLSALEQTHCTLVACDSKWVTAAFNSELWISTLVVLLQHSLVLTWLVPLKTAAASVHSVYTIQRCTMSRYLMQSHILRVHVCLAVTSNLHFGQNDQDFLHATAVMQGRSSYWNKSQHRKSTMEKKILLPQLKPVTFPIRVWCSNHWAVPAPQSLEWTFLIFCSSLAKSEPTWLHPEELQFEVFCITVDGTTEWSLQMDSSHFLCFQASMRLCFRAPLIYYACRCQVLRVRWRCTVFFTSL